MPDVPVGFKKRKPVTQRVPNAPASLTKGTLAATANPQTTYRVSYPAATLPVGGDPVTGYNLYLDGVHHKTVAATNLNPSYTGLTAGTTYTFRVAGVNAAGVGAMSPALIDTTQAAGAVPGPVTVSLVEARATAADISWTAGTPDPIAPTTDYNVYYTSDTVNPTASTAAGTLNTTLGNLAPNGASYSVIVKAVNSNGESAASNTLTFTTANETAPVNRTVQAFGTSSTLSTTTDTRITDASGLVTSREHAGYVWTHNDLNIGNVLYLVNRATGATAATLTLTGILPGEDHDYESLAYHNGRLWLFDTGNSTGTRTNLAIYSVAEPSTISNVTLAATVYPIAYADGNTASGEAGMIRPSDGRVHIAMRANAGTVNNGMYRGPATLTPNVTNTFTRLTNPAGVPAQVTDGSWSTADNIYCLVYGAGTGLTGIDIYDGVNHSLLLSTKAPVGPATEGCAWSTSGDNIFTVRDTVVGTQTPIYATPVTYATADTTLAVARTDSVNDALGYNIKASYASSTSTHGATLANNTYVTERAVEVGTRIYRESVASSGNGRTYQQNIIQAMYEANGTKVHWTIGQMRSKPNQPDIKNMTDQQLRETSATMLTEEFGTITSTFYSNLCGGDFSKLYHSIAGPNEIEAVDETGTSWPSHARVWTEGIWRIMREGKTYRASTGQWVVTHPTFPALFANIPFAGPGTRTDLAKSNTWVIYPDGSSEGAHRANAGTITTAPRGVAPGTLLPDGTYSMNTFVEMGNCHLYNAGVSPTGGREEMAKAYSPIVKTGLSAHYIFSESGYNHMGFHPTTSVWQGPANFIGRHAGQKRIPPWAVATYSPRAVLDYASNGMEWVKHELVNDIDNGSWDQEHFFGSVATPSTLDPATFVLLPDFHALRRLTNLCRDRVGNTPPTHGTTALPHTITAGGLDPTLRKWVTQKSNGRHFLFLWRNVDVWNPDTTIDPAGPGTFKPVTALSVTTRLDHTSGTRTVRKWTPNKATRTANLDGMPSVTWSPLPTTAGAGNVNFEPILSTTGASTIAAGASFTVSIGGDLEVLEIF